ncbi:MAG TPA: ABC transporter substrate-binding protein [Gaiellales bacterium]|nr:ABC transporter substrate-binding protein [Gaiellales bacterium]
MRRSAGSRFAALIAIVLALSAGGCGGASQTGNAIRIGVVRTCGNGVNPGELELAGAELPLIARGARRAGGRPSDGVTGATLAGRPVKLIMACQAFMDHQSTITALSTLVDRDRAQIVISGEDPGNGLAVRDFARFHPGVTFMLASFEPSATLRHPAPNVFRFEVDNAQWTGGLGAYAYSTLGWRRAATLGEDDPSGWPEVGGFDAEFCSRGGQISDRVWTAATDTTLGERARELARTGVDGVFFPGALQATGKFVKAWKRSHPDLGKHLLVGWVPLWPPRPSMVGVVGASPDPFVQTGRWGAYLTAFKRAFPGLKDPQLVNQPDYDAMEPVAEALAQVHGDLSHNERRFMSALSHLRYNAPEGTIRLDRRRQAIGPVYLGKIVKNQAGKTVVRQIAVVRNVDETFGGYFSPSSPSPSTSQPACVSREPTT